MRRLRRENVETLAYWQTRKPGRESEGPDIHRRAGVLTWINHHRQRRSERLRVLDVGCGDGALSRALEELEAVGSFSGIDLCPAAVEEARRKTRSSKFEFGVADASRIPYPRESFDFTWCGNTLQHVLDPEGVVRELFRVTAEGGLVAFSVPFLGQDDPMAIFAFEPSDVSRWADRWGELAYLDTCLVPGGGTLFAVIRRHVFGPDPENTNSDTEGPPEVS